MRYRQYQDHLTVMLDASDKVATLSMKTLLNEDSGFNILDTHMIRYDGARMLMYGTEGMNNLALVTTPSEKQVLKIVVGLANLLIHISEKEFYQKEFIVLNPEFVYLSRSSGAPGFVMMPLISDNAVVQEKEWLENLYSFFKGLLGSVSVYSIIELADLKADIENLYKGSWDNGYQGDADLHALPERIISDFSPEKFADPDEERPVEVQLRGVDEAEDTVFYITTPEFTIGRAFGVPGRIADSAAVSQTHCRIALADNGAFITDLASTNGTYINGERLIPNEPVRLHTEDSVSVADRVFRVVIIHQ